MNVIGRTVFIQLNLLSRTTCKFHPATRLSYMDSYSGYFIISITYNIIYLVCFVIIRNSFDTVEFKRAVDMSSNEWERNPEQRENKQRLNMVRFFELGSEGELLGPDLYNLLCTRPFLQYFLNFLFQQTISVSPRETFRDGTASRRIDSILKVKKRLKVLNGGRICVIGGLWRGSHLLIDKTNNYIYHRNGSFTYKRF